MRMSVIIEVNKLRIMRLVGHVTGLGEKKTALSLSFFSFFFFFLRKNLNEKDWLEYLGVHGLD
jgi:hypothetical protein